MPQFIKRDTIPFVQIHTAQIIEISCTAGGRNALIECPSAAIPAAGQYVQVFAPSDISCAVPVSLFLGGSPKIDADRGSFTCAVPVPENWQPGEKLYLRGPLGRGFQLPHTVQRLALVGLSEHIWRLMPIAEMVDKEIAIFSDAPLPPLPTRVEAHPLRELTQYWYWADVLLFDAPAFSYSDVWDRLNIAPEQSFPCPAQALVSIDMPCGAMAECGICAVEGKRNKILLPCQDGPVFTLSEKGLEIQKANFG